MTKARNRHPGSAQQWARTAEPKAQPGAASPSSEPAKIPAPVEQAAVVPPPRRAQPAAVPVAAADSVAATGRGAAPNSGPSVKAPGTVPQASAAAEAHSPAPESGLAVSKVPESKVPQGKEPHGKEPHGKEPEGKEPEGKEPETGTREGKAPLSGVPESKAPLSGVPESKAPESGALKAPATTAPAAAPPALAKPATASPLLEEPVIEEAAVEEPDAEDYAAPVIQAQPAPALTRQAAAPQGTNQVTPSAASQPASQPAPKTSTQSAPPPISKSAPKAAVPPAQERPAKAGRGGLIAALSALVSVAAAVIAVAAVLLGPKALGPIAPNATTASAVITPGVTQVAPPVAPPVAPQRGDAGVLATLNERARASGLLVVATQLRHDIDSGAPIALDVNALAASGGLPAPVAQAVRDLQRIAATGVPTPQGLAQGFDGVAQKASDEVLAGLTGPGRTAARVKAFLGIPAHGASAALVAQLRTEVLQGQAAEVADAVAASRWEDVGTDWIKQVRDRDTALAAGRTILNYALQTFQSAFAGA